MSSRLLFSIILLLSSLSGFSQEAQPVASAPIEAPFHRNSIGFGVGQAFLVGDYSHLGDDALTYDLYYAYRASYTFQFLVNAHYNKYETDASSIKTTSINTGIKAKIFDFDSFAPFWSLGVGFYWPQASYLEGTKQISTKKKGVFGVNASIGMDLNLNERFTIGFLTHLHYPFKAKFKNGYELSGGYLKILFLPTFSF